MDKETFELWQVEEIKTLSDELSVVKNIITGTLMLRRVSPSESYETMLKLRSVSHPNLMKIYDTALINGRCITLCEYIKGATLEEVVRYHGPYDEKTAKVVMSYVCEALSALHQKGIIHRDINPANVMTTDQGVIKVIDYDIARFYKEGQSKDTEVLGTVGYASPEQFGFLQTDSSADIYSCGVLLNFLVTGEIPSNRLCDGALRRVVEKCIMLDPEKRYQSADQLRAVLTDDRRYLRKHKYDDIEALRFRPIPGFRSKRVFPKILTVFGIIVYILSLSLYILLLCIPQQNVYPDEVTFYRTHILLILTVFGFWSLFPYLLFGDVGKYTRLFSDNLSSRRVIKKCLGWLSIVLGVVLLLITISLYNRGF